MLMSRKVGFRKIDNDLFTALVAAKLTGAGYQIVLAVIDRTIGFHRDKASISLTDFQKLTHLSRQSVRLAIKQLETMNIIYVERDGTRKTIYGLKDEGEWLTRKSNHPRLETKSPQTRKPVETRTTHIKESIKDNNNPNEFVFKIPGQVNKVNNNNNEHERTPGEVAVMQIYRARPGADTKTLPRPSQYLSVPVDTGIALPKGETQPHTIDLREEILGMSVEKAVELYRSEGAPVIHIAPTENCFDLEELLSDPNIKQYQLEAIKAWLEKVLKRRGKS